VEDKIDERLRRPTRRGERGVGADLEVARRYIEQLQTHPAADAVPRLVEILEYESWYLRERAGAALLSFGAAAAPAVERLLSGGLWYTRAAALRVLGGIGAPSSLVRIVEFLGDGNQTIAEEAARAVLQFCLRDRALATAKILHALPHGRREKSRSLLRRVDADESAKLERLMDAPAFMGAEGALTAAECGRLAAEVSDRMWGVAWSRLLPSEPLPEPERDLVRHLREVGDT